MKCPRCGADMQPVKITRLIHGSKPPRYVSIVQWQCSSCGHREKEKD